MSGPKFTPGPWLQTERAGYQEILAPSVDADWYGRERMHAVAYVDTELNEAEQEANAHLIAAAPALYEAAEYALSWFLSNDCAAGRVEKLEAALAQARGETP